MPIDPQRIQSLFLAAIEIADPTARAALLVRECGDDAELRQRVEVLLQAHDQSGSFLEKPAVEPMTTDAPAGQWIDREAPLAVTEQPGMRVGHYKLLQKIGEGGMGVVYMAEQEQPVRRMVALKIIKPGMDSDAVVARFEAERQALALMDHQNIARVFDGGTTESGRPFFVMELVKGIPITRFCDENRLTPRERLQLFVSVCEAVQHAHQKGVIHRDLKPTNVLVTLYDGKPVPKVIDFGVAKALHQKLTERTMFTAFGAVIGTLEYMSPEQAEMNALDVDTRSDVYSLGVLLYELLTGTTPLERERLRKAAYTEMVRLIREEEPQRPSMRISGSGQALARISAQRQMEPAQLARLVRGELDWIVMKALEKDRGRRYETATGLARDVERYLKDEPVEACPPSVGYRLGKFARKNRVVLSTAAAFVLLLMTAAGVSTWLALVAHEAKLEADGKREEADEARQKEAEERNRADREAALARANAAETGRALDRMSVAKGIQLAEEGNVFAALPWFVRPLERGGLSPEQEQVHRTRIACYLRHTKGRPHLRQFFFHDGPVSHAAWSADSTQVLTVCKNIVYVWDVESGKAITTLCHPAEVTAAQFTQSDSSVLAVAGSIVWRWDARIGRQLKPPLLDWGAFLQQPLAVLAQTPLQFIGNVGLQDLIDAGWQYHKDDPPEICRDGQRALFSCKQVLRLLDLKTHKLIGQWLRGAHWSNSGHALSPDGQRLLVIQDGVATAFDTVFGRKPERSINHGSPVVSVAFSPDGTRAVTIAQDRTARIWDSTTWQQAALIMVADSYPHGGGKLSPDNRLLACWGSGPAGDWGLAWWDVESGRLIGKPAERPYNVRQSFAWRPDGQQHVTASVGGEVALWNDSDQWENALLLPHKSPLSAVSYAPDGRTLLTATEDGTARIWDLRDRELPFTLKTSAEDDFSSAIGLYGIFWSQIGRILYCDRAMLKTVTNSETMVWPDQARIGSFLPPDTLLNLSANQIGLGAISPDRSRVITIKQEGVQLWDAMTKTRVGKPLESFESLIYVAFSPDSRFVVAASKDGMARLVDAKTGQAIGGPLKHEGLNYATFSPNGELLVTCGRDGMARLWWTQTGQPASEGLPNGHTVTGAAFSPNGQTVATAAGDGTVRLWDVARGAPVGFLEWKKGSSCAIAFHPSGSLLLVTNLRKDVVDNLRIWDVDSLQEVSPAFKGLYGENVAIAPPLGFWFSRDGRFVVGPLTRRGFDLTPDRRSVADLVKLSQLYSEQRLDAKGGAIPLRRQELQALWQELRAKYPDEFLVAPKAAVEWRIKQIPSNPTFHRRWLAAELAEAGWQPGEKGNEDMERNNYLQRLMALALHGRHAEAAAAADALATHWPKDGDTLYDCARVHALAAGVVRGDAALAERFAARAVALLDQAITAHYWNGRLISEDSDLDALRQRADFQTLLKKFNAKQP